MKTIKPDSDSESFWTKAPVANMVRYEPSGIYFVRAKVHGKLVRQSLDTNVLSVAKQRLADVLETEHKAIGATTTKIIGKMTFGQALAIFKKRQEDSTDIKKRTKEYNERCIQTLLRTWEGLEGADIKRITKQDCLRWRADYGGRYSATMTNGTLSILRRVFDIAVEIGARYDNPARTKEVKRARVRRKDLKLPEPEQFDALVKEVRESGSGWSHHCADAIEFFAYSGVRLNEARYICGIDCCFGGRGVDEIIVRGDPIERTKNGEIRRVPIIPEMRRLLERLKAERGEDEFRRNPVLQVRKFNRALKRACKKLGLHHLTHHDLRHLFATRCIESGVDIPTVAKWLGHKDRGVLAMQTYGHLRDKHSADMAQKVVFRTEFAPTVLPAKPNTIAVPNNPNLSNQRLAIAQAKAKYKYPWWASTDPMESFWGQVNEPVQIIPVDAFLEYAMKAMGREIFPWELDDREAVISEFCARVGKLATEKLSIKTTTPLLESKVQTI